MVCFCSAIAACLLFIFLIDFVLRIPYVRGLHKKYVLITGCDTGFGNICARKCDKMGVNVFAACLTEDGQQRLKDVTSQRVKTFHMNVAAPESVRSGLEFVKTQLPEGGGLWGLVNNAGVGGDTGPVDWLTLEDYHRVCSVNLFGLIDVTNVFLPLVKEARGRIVNTASVMGRYSLPGATPYSVSKFGVEAFSDGLRFNMRPFNVKVSIVEPGFHKTAIADQNTIKGGIDRIWAKCPQEVKQQYGEEFLQESKRVVVEDFLNIITSTKVERVVDSYCHGLFGLFPRTRYLLGWDAWLLFAPLAMLPAPVTDFISEKISSMPLPAVAKKKKVPTATLR